MEIAGTGCGGKGWLAYLSRQRYFSQDVKMSISHFKNVQNFMAIYRDCHNVPVHAQQ